MKGGFRLVASASVLSIIIASNSPSEANGTLEAELAALRAEVQALRQEVHEAKTQAAAAAGKAASVEKAAGDRISDLKVKWKGAPELSSVDGNFKFKVRGRINADANFVDQDTGITGERDVNATRIRRARLGVQGTVWRDVDYILEVDFADNRVSLADAYMQYTGLPVGIRLGHFKTFNSLEEMYSANYITFMERAAYMQAFELGVRRVGVGAIYDENKHWTLAAGYFGANAGEIANDESSAFGLVLRWPQSTAKVGCCIWVPASDIAMPAFRALRLPTFQRPTRSSSAMRRRARTSV